MKRLLLAVLCVVALLAPAAAEASSKSASRDKGRVTVDVKIKRFALVGQRVVARGVLTSRVEGAVSSNKKTLKAAGKAAAAAVGRRLATEIDEIREVSRKAGESRKARAGAEA